MTYRGFVSVQTILGGIGIVIVIVGIVFSLQNKKEEVTPVQQEEQTTTQESEGLETQETIIPPSKKVEPTAPTTPTTPVPTVPTVPTFPTEPETEEPQISTTEPETPSDPQTQTEPSPAPTPYDPGFLADARIHPGIPSENERATLPECNGRLFTVDPVNFGGITKIDATGRFDSGAPESFAWFSLPTVSDIDEYDLSAPDDIYITHVAIETGITTDGQDDTVYFAFCKDVFGYFTHVKELSDQVYKYVTDSTCFGKPHVGENACFVEVLDLIGRGSLIGKVGQTEGRFGMSVIDLRKERGLDNASQYSVFTNFATCPFDFFLSPTGYYTKLTVSTSLCTKQ